MKALLNGIVFLGSVVGVICYIVCCFFLEDALASWCAVGAAAVTGLATALFMKRYTCQRQRLVNLGDYPNLRFQNIANCYHCGLISNGLLLLTEEALIFIQEQKGEPLRTIIPLKQILDVSQGTVSRQVNGIHITKSDHSIVSFVTPEFPKLMSALNDAMNQI